MQDIRYYKKIKKTVDILETSVTMIEYVFGETSVSGFTGKVIIIPH